jgi:phospholipase C
MNRQHPVFFCLEVLCISFILACLPSCESKGCGQRSKSQATPASPAAGKIQHVVGLPNADIANSGKNSQGQMVGLTPTSLVGPYDLDHSHAGFRRMWNGGSMNGVDRNQVKCFGAPNCPPTNAAFKYVNPSEVVPYFQLAEQYTFCDRMFQTNQGPSFPAHQFIISGTSAPTANTESCAAENPKGAKNAFLDTGCTAPAGETVAILDTDGNESTKMYPCFEHATLTDELDAKSISWKYYAPSAGIIWNGPNAIKHMCVPDPTGTLCTGSDWKNHVILNQTQVLTDVANGNLPAVSWVIPTAQASDHPQKNTGLGPSWVASVVNAIGNSSYWGNTAIFVTWDDWGGWYDHVAPPIISSYEYGFRVPLIVVSPYAKAGFVSHQTHDFGSILKFIEETFGLATVGYADANADDLSDSFDFQQTPLVFQPVAARYDAAYFLSHQLPPEGPDDD